MSFPSAAAFATATSVANFVAAVITANEGRKRAREGGGAFEAMEESARRTAEKIVESIDRLSQSVESVERSATKLFQMFDARFEGSQKQLTLALEMITRDRRRDT